MGDGEKKLEGIEPVQGQEQKTVEANPEVVEPILEDPAKKKDATVITAEQLAMMRKMHINMEKYKKKKAFMDVQKQIETRKKLKRREKNRNARRARKVRLHSGG